MTYEPVRTVADLATLDYVEMREGYFDAVEGLPEPGNNRSRSYWHGWRNGALDHGIIEKDDAHSDLARACFPGGTMSPEYLIMIEKRDAP